jgi:hypothetical protein
MDMGMQYILKEKEIAVLKSTLAESNIPQEERDVMIRILEEGGVRLSLSSES